MGLRPKPRPSRSLLLVVMMAVAACGAPRASEPKPAAAAIVRGPPLRFAYEGIDGRPVSSESLAGRMSVIALLTTYDVASQVQARSVENVGRRHTPRINVAALVLEPPEARPLVEAFSSALRLTYPIALADAATIVGNGPFAGLHHVPSLVVLDPEGREVWRQIGLTDESALERALRKLEAATPQP